MLGAVAGDIIGSVYEGNPIKRTDFKLFHPLMTFTDDTVLTIATAHAILTDGDYGRAYFEFANRYPNAGYGGRFRRWFHSPSPQPYNSFGNGSAMRVSPAGWAFNTLDEVLLEAEKTALPTHDHPESIKGAQAVAASIFFARKGFPKEDIRDYVSQEFGYDMERTVDDIRPDYLFNVTCQGSVPEAIICFLDSQDLETSIRNAVSLGGDSDTQACIAGSMAQAAFGVPDAIRDMVRSKLPGELWSILQKFEISFITQK